MSGNVQTREEHLHFKLQQRRFAFWFSTAEAKVHICLYLYSIIHQFIRFAAVLQIFHQPAVFIFEADLCHLKAEALIISL